MEILTIGFTKRSAQSFFGALKAASVTRLIDVRLNNVSQLAGFTKREDLRYFLKVIDGIEYDHELLLAPTQPMLDDYKKHRIPWSEYERAFLGLMAERRIEERLSRSLFDGRAVLLCSERTPERCHRRLVAEYLQGHWGNISIEHL
ncbi:MAG: DUF488 family protein [Acidimicrobiales bacterium]|jgi:uncharacterized protein (DUF488 family)